MHRQLLQLIPENHDKKQANSKLAVIRSPTPNHNKFGGLDTCIITILILSINRQLIKLAQQLKNAVSPFLQALKLAIKFANLRFETF